MHPSQRRRRTMRVEAIARAFSRFPPHSLCGLLFRRFSISQRAGRTLLFSSESRLKAATWKGLDWKAPSPPLCLFSPRERRRFRKACRRNSLKAISRILLHSLHLPYMKKISFCSSSDEGKVVVDPSSHPITVVRRRRRKLLQTSPFSLSPFLPSEEEKFFPPPRVFAHLMPLLAKEANLICVQPSLSACSGQVCKVVGGAKTGR